MREKCYINELANCRSENASLLWKWRLKQNKMVEYDLVHSESQQYKEKWLDRHNWVVMAQLVTTMFIYEKVPWDMTSRQEEPLQNMGTK